MAQMLFNPNAFTAQKAKPMPVVLVLDNSGSMSGNKIQQLNAAVHEMIETFRQTECSDASFMVAIITFGTGIHLQQEMADASQIQWTDIPISDINTSKSWNGKFDDPEARGTPLGATLKIVKSMIEDRTIIPSRAYRPAVILVSDGHPTDSWNAQLTSFIQDGRTAKCDRWAVAIGSDADEKTLQKFISNVTNLDGSPRKLLYAGNATTLRDNFKYITMTVTNTVAVMSKSKILKVQPITVKATSIERKPTPNPQEHGSVGESIPPKMPKLMQKPKDPPKEEETDSDFEW